MKRSILIHIMMGVALCTILEASGPDPLKIFRDRPQHKKTTAVVPKSQSMPAENTEETAVQPEARPQKPDPLSILSGRNEQERPDKKSSASGDPGESLGSKLYHFFFSESEEPMPEEDKNATLGTEHNQTFPTVEVNGSKILYLTFDDGPVYGTLNVLRVLQKEHIKATMFLVGRQVEADPKLFQAAVALPDVLVGNHTYSHADGHYRRFYSDKETVMQDIAKAQDLIGEGAILRLAGRNVWRLPEIHKDDTALAKEVVTQEIPVYDALEKKGYRIYGWDMEWRFDHHTHLPLYTPAELAYRVALRYNRHTMKKGKIIVLAHDYMFRDENGTQRLTTFIEMMKRGGWSFESIDTY